MITYLGRVLTPQEELTYIDAVLNSHIELVREYNRMLHKGPDGATPQDWAVFWTRIYLFGLVVSAEWERWVRLYDAGARTEWPRLPNSIF